MIFSRLGRLPGASWASLGRSWGALGRSWPPLGRILGASLVLWDASWLPNAAQDGLGLDFGRSGRRCWNVFGRPGLVFEGFRGGPWEALGVHGMSLEIVGGLPGGALGDIGVSLGRPGGPLGSPGGVLGGP